MESNQDQDYDYEIVVYNFGNSNFRHKADPLTCRPEGNPISAIRIKTSDIWEHELKAIKDPTKLIYIYQGNDKTKAIVPIYFISDASYKRYLKTVPELKKKIGKSVYINTAIQFNIDKRSVSIPS